MFGVGSWQMNLADDNMMFTFIFYDDQRQYVNQIINLLSEPHKDKFFTHSL